MNLFPKLLDKPLFLAKKPVKRLCIEDLTLIDIGEDQLL